MNKHHPFNDIIEKKLEQLPMADADHLWNEMHSILDKKMPEKKERRRFTYWLLNTRNFYVLMFMILFLTGSSIFYFSLKQNSVAPINNLPGTNQKDDVIKDVSKITSQRQKALITEIEPGPRNNATLSRPALLTDFNNKNDRYNSLYQRTDNVNQNMSEKQSIEISLYTYKNTPGIEMDVVVFNPNFGDYLTLTSHDKKVDSVIDGGITLANKSTHDKRRNKESVFYSGIVCGIDLSSVGVNSSRTGSTKGFIIGYSFNNRWSAESGLLWDTKRVYDDGSFFNPPGYTPSGGITITAVNGKSRIYEWPLNIKYNILPGKHNLFATTGISSYLMRTENYDYEYLQNNQPAGHNYLSYTNQTKNWFAVANFSLGYTHTLGSTASIRLEPYLKLPIKDIGVGKMPIISRGLNIGFIKKIK